ncbi:hypothetical protein [Xanthomonas arboricola]|uniref:hypothetical protein n=1 Tax=Xanthomonas arboricola TaxID=56448 RepID=UPI0011B0A2F7|nr:hypothetical protein [Xanthomonas arboricola]
MTTSSDMAHGVRLMMTNRCWCDRNKLECGAAMDVARAWDASIRCIRVASTGRARMTMHAVVVPGFVVGSHAPRAA